MNNNSLVTIVFHIDGNVISEQQFTMHQLMWGAALYYLARIQAEVSFPVQMSVKQ